MSKNNIVQKTNKLNIKPQMGERALLHLPKKQNHIVVGVATSKPAS